MNITTTGFSRGGVRGAGISALPNDAGVGAGAVRVVEVTGVAGTVRCLTPVVAGVTAGGGGEAVGLGVVGGVGVEAPPEGGGGCVAGGSVKLLSLVSPPVLCVPPALPADEDVEGGTAEDANLDVAGADETVGVAGVTVIAGARGVPAGPPGGAAGLVPPAARAIIIIIIICGFIIIGLKNWGHIPPAGGGPAGFGHVVRGGRAPGQNGGRGCVVP